MLFDGFDGVEYIVGVFGFGLDYCFDVVVGEEGFFCVGDYYFGD